MWKERNVCKEVVGVISLLFLTFILVLALSIISYVCNLGYFYCAALTMFMNTLPSVATCIHYLII